MKKIAILALLTCFLTANGLAQNQEKEKKNYWKASLELTALNYAVWFYDAKIMDFGWANISLESMKRNFKKGYWWSNDGFRCDNIEHPFHGAMYFSAGRTNGLNFWESAALPFLGSAMWELMLENNRPSTIDGILTSAGGVLLGEPLFRIANDLIIRNNAKGLEKVVREIFGFIINPTLVSDRLATGKSFKRTGASAVHDYDTLLPLGVMNGKPFFAIQLQYADIWNKKDVAPYDWFELNLSASSNPENFQSQHLSVTGNLLGKKLAFGKSRAWLGIFGHYGYFDFKKNPAVAKHSAFGFGPGLIWLKQNKQSSLMLTAMAFGTASSSTSSFTLQYGDRFFDQFTEKHEFDRNSASWHFGPGIATQIGLSYKNNRLIGNIRWNEYAMRSRFIKTSEKLTAASLDLSLKLYRSLWLNTGINAYAKRGQYKNLNLFHSQTFWKAGIAFRF